MIKAGITGGIGSGKSTVCKVWESLGAKIVYADDLAKELMATDIELKNRLKESFGEETYLANGELNKSHLIREAFQKNRVRELNELVHPAVRKAFSAILNEEEKKNTQLIVKEAALLLLNGRPPEFDWIVLVKANINHRVERVIHRDDVTREDVLARIEKQPDFEADQKWVDFVIENDGTKEELIQNSRNIFYKMKK